jgi:uncharacterized protein YcfJ
MRISPLMFSLWLSAASLPVAASAHGCIKGAVVGGVVGHLAGHHGVAGAAVGCALGHHRAKEQEATRAQTATQIRPAQPSPALPPRGPATSP